MSSKKPKLLAEMTSCGTTGQIGVIIWLGTNSKKAANKIADKLVSKINKKFKTKLKGINNEKSY